jgi:glucokinase
MMSEVTIGADLGGSKTAAGIVSSTGDLLERIEVPTQKSAGAAATLAMLLDLVTSLVEYSLRHQLYVTAVGVATAGIVDKARGVVTTTTDALPGWSAVPIRKELEQALGLEVSVLNDVHAMAMAEGQLGRGKGVDDVLYLAVGTGIGGAISHSGVVRSGAHGWAGDIGHIVVDRSDQAALCPCGRTGHLEAYASGPALAVRYETVSGTQLNGGLRLVAARARDGDELARDVLREGAEFLGRAIGGIVNLLDPELVVFGGGLADLDADLFWCHTIRMLQAEVRAGVPIPCLPARLRNDAAMIGAALAAGTKVNLN